MPRTFSRLGQAAQRIFLSHHHHNGQFRRRDSHCLSPPGLLSFRCADLNVKAPFFLLQKLLPLLERAGSAEDPARVINIGSVDGLHSPIFENFSYAPSKAALHHPTRVVAGHLAQRHINVNCIARPFRHRHDEPDGRQDGPRCRHRQCADEAHGECRRRGGCGYLPRLTRFAPISPARCCRWTGACSARRERQRPACAALRH